MSHGTPEEYEADPTRCCPWCTESQRRRAVHAGNERKQEELATAVEKKVFPYGPTGPRCSTCVLNPRSDVEICWSVFLVQGPHRKYETGPRVSEPWWFGGLAASFDVTV